jgi:prolyl oligopeptidase
VSDPPTPTAPAPIFSTRRPRPRPPLIDPKPSSLSSYVYSHNTGLQAQSVVFTQATPGADATVLLDPNTLSKDGTVALGSTSFSEDGTLLAYALSSGGSDWRTVHVLAVDQTTGAPAPLADKLEHVKFTSLAWTHEGKGFFYHRYPPPAKGGDLGTEVDSNVDKEMWCVVGRAGRRLLHDCGGGISARLHVHSRIARANTAPPASSRYHVVGQPQSDDVFLYAIPEQPTWHIGAEVTDDGRCVRSRERGEREKQRAEKGTAK